MNYYCFENDIADWSPEDIGDAIAEATRTLGMCLETTAEMARKSHPSVAAWCEAQMDEYYASSFEGLSGLQDAEARLAAAWGVHRFLRGQGVSY